MGFFIIFSAVSSCLTFLPQTESLVVTKYSPEILSNYFYHLKLYSEEKGLPSPTFSNWSFADYCDVLRQSKVFKLVDTDEESGLQLSPTRRLIPKEILDKERQQHHLVHTLFRVPGLKNMQSLSSFQCADLKGNTRWFVTPAYIPDSAFLHTIVPSVFAVLGRQAKPNNIIYPKLAGIIDESATPAPGSSISYWVRTRFADSIQSADIFSQDELCNLHSILQFRLCAICTDHIRISHVRLQGEPSSAYIYPDEDFTSYFQPEDPFKRCPPVAVDKSGNTRRLLACPIYSPDESKRYSFYLSQNMLNDSTVFLALVSGISQSITYLEELQVPLLQHVTKYSKALEKFHNHK